MRLKRIWQPMLIIIMAAFFSPFATAQAAKNGPCGEMQGFGLVNHKGWELPFVRYKVVAERHPHEKTKDPAFNRSNVYVSEMKASREPMGYPFPVIIGRDCIKLYDSYIKLERILRYDIDGKVF